MDRRVGVIEAFAAYGATLENEEFAYSALAPDGSVVVSCWSHRVMWGPDGFSHMGYLTRMRDNRIGADIFAWHLTLAWEGKRPLRLVMATAGDTRKVEQSMNLDNMVKTYTARPEFVGELVSFDGNDYVYEFRRSQPAAKGSKVAEIKLPASDK